MNQNLNEFGFENQRPLYNQYSNATAEECHFGGGYPPQDPPQDPPPQSLSWGGG